MISQLLVFFFKPLHTFSSFCRQGISRKIKVNGRSVTIAEVKIFFPKDIGIGINSKLYWDGSDGYESLTAKSLINFFVTCDTFFDIGSNFGFYSVLARKLNPKIKAYCFEPLPNIYHDNLAFHKVNGLSHLNTFNIAISDSQGEVVFFVPNVYSIDSEITSASLERDFFYNRAFPKKEITVKTNTLDLFFGDHRSDLIDKRVILKVDVEGHESSVIKGAQLFIAEIRPYLIIEVDMAPENINTLGGLFTGLKYSFYCLTALGFFRIDYHSLFEVRGGRDFLLLPNEKCTNKDFIAFEQLSDLVRM